MAMELNPLLTFNTPKTNGDRAPLQGGGGAPNTPDIGKQSKKIFPKLEQLQHKFAEHIQLSDSPMGMQPEKVLVLEIAGEIQDLASALNKIPGFELLSQALVDKNFKDDDFYIRDKDKIKSVNKNVYLAMSNQSGLDKLHARWKEFKETGSIHPAPLKYAFMQLIDLRFWDTQDRLESTYLMEDWKYRLDDANQNTHFPQEHVNFEIELWYRISEQHRSFASARISKLIHQHGGDVKNEFIHNGIGYHGILGQLPITQVQEVINSGGEAVELMRCDDVMFFRPLGQCTAPTERLENEEINDELEATREVDLQGKEPIVALFDGLPLSNHLALQNRIQIDDPDNLESLYDSPQEQIHGTSMASIIVHGDLNNPQGLQLNSPLYVRPILAPGRRDINGSRAEQIPENTLPIDLIHRAVVRMKKGDGNLPATAPNVAIINLSIGDPYRLFDTQMSPWARMLDWLSEKYSVLFVVSAGNMTHDLILEGINEHRLHSISLEELEGHALKAISKQKHERRMMSPSEAINALTVRAAHSDEYKGNIPTNQYDIFNTDGLFSPINPVTLGKKNSVKPEIMMPGGRQTYVNKSLLPNEDVVLRPSNSYQFGPGIKTAIPSSTSGALNSYGFTSGTSNAAAMTTRRLAFLHETLRNMRELGDSEALKSASDSVILKALMVHGAGHISDASQVIKNHLKSNTNSRTFKSDLNQFLGFGLVDQQRIHGCIDQQATLIYTGKINDDGRHDYFLPMPASLSAEVVERRLIVTIAWMSPVTHTHQDYRGAQLWATPAHKEINANDSDYYYHHLKHGTIYHDVRRGSKAAIYADGDKLGIQVHCNIRAGMKGLEIPYALVVTLDAPGSNLPIYEEVKQGLEISTEQMV